VVVTRAAGTGVAVRLRVIEAWCSRVRAACHVGRGGLGVEPLVTGVTGSAVRVRGLGDSVTRAVGPGESCAVADGRTAWASLITG
jgi:hypothetical protein